VRRSAATISYIVIAIVVLCQLSPVDREMMGE